MIIQMAKQAKPTKKAGKSKKAGKADDKNERVISDNRKARHKYHCARYARVRHRARRQRSEESPHWQLSLDEAYGRVDNDEVWLVGANIAEYPFSHALNHEPKRRRKLLMHRREQKNSPARLLRKVSPSCH